MQPTMTDIWVYLAQTPLLWLTATLVIYELADIVYRRIGQWPPSNPVLISVVILITFLTLTGTPYQRYFDGAQFVHFLLGPTTVALALPLWRYARRLRRMLLPLSGALLIGSLTSILSVVAIGRLMGVSEVTLRSLAPKSVTTPIAMGISEQIGGLPSLTAVLVIVTGIIGAVIAQELFDRLRVDDQAARGLAIGVASHGIGTARALQMHAEAGAFAGLAMGLNGALTTLLAPLLARLLGL
jgi:predicted murein hydrolase (TIGR00659 family)